MRDEPATARRLRERIVLDSQGTAWAVREVSASHVPGSRGRYCLIFDSPHRCRRLWAYPADWHALPDAQLLALDDIV